MNWARSRRGEWHSERRQSTPKRASVEARGARFEADRFPSTTGRRVCRVRWTPGGCRREKSGPPCARPSRHCRAEQRGRRWIAWKRRSPICRTSAAAMRAARGVRGYADRRRDPVRTASQGCGAAARTPRAASIGPRPRLAEKLHVAVTRRRKPTSAGPPPGFCRCPLPSLREQPRQEGAAAHLKHLRLLCTGRAEAIKEIAAGFAKALNQ